MTEYIYVPGPLDYILHFASPASPIDYLELPDPDAEGRLAGHAQGAGAGQGEGRAFLLASTSEVYGDPLVHPQPEDYWGNVNPDRPARRLRRGQAVRRGDDDGLPPLPRRGHADRPDLQHLRPAHAAQRRARACRRSSCQALRGEPLTVFGDGSQTRSFCYVDDLIEGICRLLHSDYDEPVNIGNPAEMTMLQFAEAIVRFTGVVGEIVLRAAAGGRSRRCASPTSPWPRACSAGSRGSLLPTV